MTKDQEEFIHEQNVYSGVTEWHDKGFKGDGVVVWTCEDPSSDHCRTTRLRILEASPNATVIMASYSFACGNDKYGNDVVYYHYVNYEGEKYDIEEFIKKFNIKVITKSVGGGTREGGAESKYWIDLRERYNLIFFNSAGNNGEKGCGGCFPPDVAIYVGACNLMAKTNKPQRAHYSSIGKQLDFMQFTGIWSGTSFASPYMAGMTALLCQKYPNITQDEVFEYFKNNAEDLEDVGRDNDTGYGLAKMGDCKETVIKIPIGRYAIDVDGISVNIDQPAIIDPNTNRTLVPLRAICEIMGAEVEWDKNTKTAIITRT